MLVEHVIWQLEYAVHELPYGYIGNSDDDARMLDEANGVAAGLKDQEKRSGYMKALAELNVTVDRYRRYLRDKSHVPYFEWVDRDHNG
jgi:hypothetical protein